MKTVTFRVGGIDCAACVERLNRLTQVPGVAEFTVNPVNSHAHIRYDETKISARELERRIRRLGYSVSCTEVRIGLEEPLGSASMHKLESIEGVKEALI